MNGLREPAVKGSNARERHLDETVPAGFFHELGDAIGVIDFHHYEETLRSGDSYYLAELGRTTE